MNKAIIVGNLGKDPSLRTTQNGTAVCQFSVATTEFKKGADGEREDCVEWHNIVTWQKTAENCDKFLKKGSKVLVEGRLQTRSWDDKGGNKRYTTEIVANNVEFLSPKNQSDAKSSGQSGGSNEPSDTDIPF